MVYHTIVYHTVKYMFILSGMHARFLATCSQLSLSDPDCSCACAYIMAWHVDQSASIWV